MSKTKKTADTNAVEATPGGEPTLAEGAPAAEAAAGEAAADADPVVEKQAGIETVSKADYEALRKRLDESEKIAKDERDLRLTREFVAKAAGYDRLPIAAEALGPILKRASENALTQADTDEIDRVLAGVNEQLKLGKVLGEVGRTGAGEHSAWAKAEAAAAELRKADSGLTKEQAIAKVLKDQPTLASACDAESH